MDIFFARTLGSLRHSFESEPLVSGMKVIKNMDGIRNGLGDHSEVMFSLDGKPQENSGRVIGAALCWSGRTKIRVDMDDTFGRSVHSIFCRNE